MHPKYLCRSVVARTPKLLELRFALKFVVVPCQYFPNPSSSLYIIFPSLSYHISSVAVLHLLCRNIHPCCTTSPPPCSSAAFFTADIVCHPQNPKSPPLLRCFPPMSLLRSSSHYLPSSHVLWNRILSTFSDRIFSLLCVVLYYTAYSALLLTTFLTFRSDILTTFFSSILTRLFSLSVMLLLRSDLPRFFYTCLLSALLQSDHSPQLCLLRSA